MIELPSGWSCATLAELTEPRREAVVPSPGEDLPYVGLEHVEPNTTKIIGRGDASVLRSTTLRFRPGDTLYGRLRPYLNKVCAPEFEGLASAEFMVFGPAVAFAPRYLLHFLTQQSFVSFASHVNEGDRPRVKWDQIASHAVPLPPLNEQRRIVAAIEEQFSRLDAAEESLRRAGMRVQGLRDAVYSAAVAGQWPTVPLAELLREPLRNGHSAKAAPGGEVRTLTLTAVTRREFTDQNTKLTNADPSRIESLWLRSGDVLIERSNTPELVGTAALYRGPERWAIFPDLMIRVRVCNDVVPEFLELTLKSQPARGYFRRSAQGIAGSMPKIDQGAVERFQVPLPPVDEQRRIVAEVEQQLSVIETVGASIEVAKRRSASLGRSILERAFRGELVAQDPADEPASVLLERIRTERAAAAPAPRRRRVSA